MVWFDATTDELQLVRHQFVLQKSKLYLLPHGPIYPLSQLSHRILASPYFWNQLLSELTKISQRRVSVFRDPLYDAVQLHFHIVMIEVSLLLEFRHNSNLPTVSYHRIQVVEVGKVGIKAIVICRNRVDKSNLPSHLDFFQLLFEATLG